MDIHQVTNNCVVKENVSRGRKALMTNEEVLSSGALSLMELRQLLFLTSF